MVGSSERRDLPGVVHVGKRVADALEGGAPVVALETAVLTHGLPAGIGQDALREMVEAVGRSGAVPAVVAVVGGRVEVGLEPGGVAALAGREDVRKCALRDLALLAADGGWGGTTVSATAWVAARCGIPVMATGGIGGVHLDGRDVSADLDVLAATRIVVVCSGPKSLLDLAATSERLESLSVPVLGYRTSRLPAFYVAETDLPVTARVEDAAQVARIVRARDALGLAGALLVAVPVPVESGLDARLVADAAARAESEADREGVSGARRTPFVLARMAALSGGATLDANRALLARNAHVAGEVAAALAEAGRP